MQTQNFLIFAIALSIAVATPGPGIFAVVSCAIGRGFRDAVALTCGIVVGDLIFFVLAALGMTVLAHSMGELFLFVKFAGGAYLILAGRQIVAHTHRNDGRASPCRRGSAGSVATCWRVWR